MKSQVSRALIFLSLVGGQSLLSACERALPTAAPATHLRVEPTVMTPAVADRLMGRLSPLARHLVIALRDSDMRAELAGAMKRQELTHPGIDLSDCNQGESRHLMERGEANGGSHNADICALIKSMPGVMLYMAPEQLAKWDATVIPSVTAIDNASGGRAGPKQAYRSPDRMIDISDRSFRGPLLVVLPFVHGARTKGLTSHAPNLVTRIGPTALPALGSRAGPPVLPGYVLKDSIGRSR